MGGSPRPSRPATAEGNAVEPAKNEGKASSLGRKERLTILLLEVRPGGKIEKIGDKIGRATNPRGHRTDQEPYGRTRKFLSKNETLSMRGGGLQKFIARKLGGGLDEETKAKRGLGNLSSWERRRLEPGEIKGIYG